MLIRNCFFALFFSIFFISTACAMRCGEKLVYEGDSEFDVLSKCGEPLDKQVYNQPVPQYNAEGEQIGAITNSISKWIYQKSPADFQYELIFDAGVLKQINTNRNP
ncbi:DUF2845 domain-containing protein [Legionella maioricensis]|uniref:DUF2845 domain-containing protein n=1 Tax=Legionella maioricensis TaxID=2896528 RepID=A0A9X2ICD8_9GAMM|nr:DUF2845 domain-containing protein [Legionella maioricensis]MCL9685819.1 DUF2845 domain-containing protein [Legionella maioricensis]MCL9689266.1 DUF2845 domain-containing protein [Legionella maioricensis]